MQDFLKVHITGRLNGATIDTSVAEDVLVGQLIPVNIGKIAAEAAALASWAHNHNLGHPNIDRRQ